MAAEATKLMFAVSQNIINNAPKVAHIIVFLLSIIAAYKFRNNTLISMGLSELIILYVALVNYKRREIIPPLAICLFFKIIEYPVSVWQFEHAEAQTYLFGLIVFDAMLLLTLSKLYRSNIMWSLFRIDVPQLPIPQVYAIITILSLGIFHLALVTTEVMLHHFALVNFTEVPFFYRSFPEVRATFKVIVMLGVWSMMLDAYYHPQRRKI